MEQAVFIIAGACCLFSAIGVVAARQNPVHSALSLIGSLFSMAVLFIAQEAYFLAAVQVIVYAGAVVVLFLFVIMLLGVDEAEPDYVNRRWLTGAGLAAAASIFVLTAVISVWGSDDAVAAATTQEPDVNQIGRLLFTDYVYVFEITGVLLTIAVVGAVMLSRRAGGRPWDDDEYPEPEGDAAIAPDPSAFAGGGDPALDVAAEPTGTPVAEMAVDDPATSPAVPVATTEGDA